MIGRRFGGGAFAAPSTPSVERTFASSGAAFNRVGGPVTPGSTIELNMHINSAAPHALYDDMQDMTLIFENGLV